MRAALVNPPWSFEGSIYFGCREPHLPLEYGYAKALLEAAGHEATIVDGQLGGLTIAGVRERVAAFAPDVTVITTALSHLFWRCAPPELRVPKLVAEALRDVGGALVVVGPHASTTPGTTLRKLRVDAAVVGECEEVLLALASTPRAMAKNCRKSTDEPTRLLVIAKQHVAFVQLRWGAPDDRAWERAHAHYLERFDAFSDIQDSRPLPLDRLEASDGSV